MKLSVVSLTVILIFTSLQSRPQTTAWIRINQLGYKPAGIKVAVWCSKEQLSMDNLLAGGQAWQLINASTKEIVYSKKFESPFGTYGPFAQSYRLNFSSFNKPGRYYLQAGDTRSSEFEIGDDVYKGAADFCLRYMRQQRSGFNPFLKDSCHTHDGYVLYGEKAGIKDSTHIDVVGGWHDASDYLQYASTSANATYNLLMAWRDFPKVFSDEKLANGLDGKNGMADVLDEAKWGLDWLLKMHPKENWMFNQVGDDRDHIGMRIPKEDSAYGKGYERPVYFVSGEPQQRGKFMNHTTGASSIAGKFASAFALGFEMFGDVRHSADVILKNSEQKDFGDSLLESAISSYKLGEIKKGVTQTASVRSPYIYAEENWADDMELAGATIYGAVKGWISHMFSYLDEAFRYSQSEKVTPWLGSDTANHYQWYPFINIGHYEFARQCPEGWPKDTIIGYYKQGIQRVWNRAKQNAFYRGVPFIWCSNNLTTAFAIQCFWYRQLTGDKTFSELEQANFDWLFGCNPWGTSFVYGLPANGNTPVDPHSALTHLKNYPIDGGLVDGPVYGSIYNNLIGITLAQRDEYAEFQSNLAVYHDDYGDYSTNEPTMDGTATLIYLLAAKESEHNVFSYDHGAIIRGDSSSPSLTWGNRRGPIALVFTGDEFADGGKFIASTLHQQNIKASFFFTGRFYSNPAFKKIIERLNKDGHYLGPHSNHHLLYCDWNRRDSLLVTKEDFTKDLLANLDVMQANGIDTSKTKFFLPPYEWYNDSIAAWTKESGLQLINYTPGTLSHADYTTPADRNYRSSDEIYKSIIDHETLSPSGLNGFILLMHIGTDPKRTDKFYRKLPGLISYLRSKGYHFQSIGKLLQQ
jgi:endoglucanase